MVDNENTIWILTLHILLSQKVKRDLLSTFDQAYKLFIQVLELHLLAWYCNNDVVKGKGRLKKTRNGVLNIWRLATGVEHDPDKLSGQLEFQCPSLVCGTIALVSDIF